MLPECVYFVEYLRTDFTSVHVALCRTQMTHHVQVQLVLQTSTEQNVHTVTISNFNLVTLQKHKLVIRHIHIERKIIIICLYVEERKQKERTRRAIGIQKHLLLYMYKITIYFMCRIVTFSEQTIIERVPKYL